MADSAESGEMLDSDTDSAHSSKNSSPSLPVSGAHHDSVDSPDKAQASAVVMVATVLLGIGFLAPWHCLITAVDYLGALYPERAVQFDLVICYSLPNALTFALALRWAHYIPVRVRVVGGFSVFAALLFALPVLDYAQLLADLYYLLLVIVVLIGIIDGWVQSGIYVFASMISPRHVVGVQMGMGLSGIVVCIARGLSKAFLGAVIGGAEVHMYFFIGVFCMLACIFSFEWSVRRDPIARHALIALSSRIRKDGSERTALTVDVEEDGISSNDTIVLNRVTVIKKVWPSALFTLFTLAVTISVFPGVVSEIEEVHFGSEYHGWITLALISSYNVADFGGKLLPRWSLFRDRVRPLFCYILAAVRVIFVPWIITLVLAPSFFRSIAWAFVVTTLLAASNGYLGSYFLANTPSFLAAHERDLGITLITAGLVIGLAIGSGVGFALSTALR